MKLAVSQVCSLAAPVERDLEEYAASGVQHVEAWFTKLEQYLAAHTTDDLRRLLGRYELQVPVGSMQGGLFTPDAAARDVAWTLFRQRLELCQSLGITTIVVACDVPGPCAQRDVQRVLSALRTIAAWGREHAVRVALEFQATAALGNNLQTAAALIQDVDDPWLGICLDAFHFEIGPSKPDDLAHLTAANLFHVQLSDLSGRLRELATDGDRILPGDGELSLGPLVARLRAIHYAGVVSVEVMNPQIVQISARQVSETCLAALRRVIPDHA
jgi:sugar phosphate isomerase/epimerase